MNARARALTKIATVCELAAAGMVAAAVLLLDSGERLPVFLAACATGAVGLACDLRAASLRD